MRWFSLLRVLVAIELLYSWIGVPAEAQTLSRWGDYGAEGSGGSFQIGLQKRLSQAGLKQWVCPLCAHYTEVWVEFDEEVDDGAIDRDVQAIGLGWRYYLWTGDRNPRKREGLAGFMRLGLSRIDLDPGDTHSGYYGGFGLEYPITQSYYTEGPNKGKLRDFWVSAIATVTQNEIERGTRDLDYTSAQIGVRFIFPSARDRRRSECLYGRVEEVKRRLDAQKLASVMVDGKASDFEEDIENLDVWELFAKYPRELDALFDRGSLVQPSACFEPIDDRPFPPRRRGSRSEGG